MEPNNQHIPEQRASSIEGAQVASELQSAFVPTAPPPSKPKPRGEVMMPALICGSVGTVLTTILSLINRYKGLDQSLKEKYMAEPFLMPDVPALHGIWNWIIVLVVCFGISFAVLDSDKVWRRVILFFLSLVIIVMGSPVLMMWDIFWSPWMVAIGLVWSWFCAFIYSFQHTMPCELLVPAKKIKPAKKPKVAKEKPKAKAKPTKPVKVKPAKSVETAEEMPEFKPTKKETPVFVAPVAKEDVDSVPFAEIEEPSSSLPSTAKFQPKEQK